MKAIARTLTIAGLIAGGSNAFASQWPVRGSQLETACSAYLAKAWDQQRVSENLRAESNAVFKAALQLTDEDIKKISEEWAGIEAADPSKKDSLANVAFMICWREQTESDLALAKKALLDPKSFMQASERK